MRCSTEELSAVPSRVTNSSITACSTTGDSRRGDAHGFTLTAQREVNRRNGPHQISQRQRPRETRILSLAHPPGFSPTGHACGPAIGIQLTSAETYPASLSSSVPVYPSSASCFFPYPFCRLCLPLRHPFLLAVVVRVSPHLRRRILSPSRSVMSNRANHFLGHPETGLIVETVQVR